MHGDAAPHFIFGPGLSNTIFQHHHLSVTPSVTGPGAALLKFDLANPGIGHGDEVVPVCVPTTMAKTA